jgi:NAD(P)H dehydrogenase (quinone)
VNVLITFYCLDGAAEKLALAAAVGAVQGRAAIRLRRLDPQPGENTTEERLNQEYVAPKEADARWADAIILGTPARLSVSSPVLNEYFGLLRNADVRGKLGAIIVAGGAPEALHRAMTELGFNVVAQERAIVSVDDARLLGRRVAELAAKSKSRVLS